MIALQKMKYIIGLDLGTTSIGWAVVDNDKNKIEDLGVRLFESAENPYDGKSLAEPRRLARSMRRRLARRGYRLEKIKTVFIDGKLLTPDEIKSAHSTANDPYQLRAEGLDRILNNHELFIVVYHLAKRRGYKSNRKKVLEENADVKDTKAVLGSIKENVRLLKEKGLRTVGEMFYKELKDNKENAGFDGVRNKPGTYKHSVSREMLQEELKMILKTQSRLGNLVTKSIETDILQAFSFQRPYAQGDRLKDMVGYCTFEKEERRAAKATYSFQYFNLLQKLNHLIIENPNGKRPLTDNERKIIIETALKQRDIDFGKIKKWLKLAQEDRFNMVNYVVSRKDLGTKSLEELKDSCEKKTKFSSLRDYYDVREKIRGADEAFWDTISDNIAVIDAIGEILTLYKTDEDISKYLGQIEIDGVKDIFPKIVEDALLGLSFAKFGHLSLKALRKIIPYLEEGLNYDKAVVKADPKYVQNLKTRTHKLQPISKNDHSITNPVARRTIAQTIKVVNAIIDRHGSPSEVHIELGRELSKDFRERRQVTAHQEVNKDRNQQAVDLIRDKYAISQPSGQDIVKFKLWQEQNCKCAYSGKPIDERRLFEPGYTEIDHIIPFSRSFDDSYNNRVLVLTQANQEKLNKLPYECFGHDEDKWQEFQNLVASMHLHPRKESNLLLKKYVADELTARTLNDSRYIAKYLKNYIENTLQFAESGEKRRVLTVNGMATAYVRKRWGLNKDREESSTHHAQDAAIVAATDASLIRKVALFSKLGHIQKYLKTHKNLSKIDATPDEIEEAKKLIAQYESGQKNQFPEPWPGFRNQLEARIHDDSFFVSHMPRRKTTGKVHDATLRSPKLFAEEKSLLRTPLTSLTRKVLEKNKATIDPNLYKTFVSCLQKFDGDAKKAFAEPFYKTQRDGTRGPAVRTLKLARSGQKSGILINAGKALVDRSFMIRVDIFSKRNKKDKNEYYFIPIYAHHIRAKQLPERVVTIGKKETEWNQIDKSFTFEFSLYPDDLMKITKKRIEEYWYYTSADIATASFAIESHDRAKQKKGVGIKTLDKLEKYVVGVLGDYHKVGKEIRQTFT